MSTATPVRHPTDTDLLARVLRCYKPNCRYLRAMSVSAVDGHLLGTAELAVDESCYIDDTGHLNAVEVNIAYNQMLYYAIALAVREDLVPAVLGTWTMDDYWRRQLPDILITRMVSRFRWPVDPRRFHGEFALTGHSSRRLSAESPPLIALETGFRFWDDHRGRSDGEVTVAIVAAT
ncbi:FcoT family thioesterase [Actinokineospora fastidiosa]|uniref:(2E)-enoyl-[ACP] glycyltransferase n=1 Tax=Actinokineospora fastidiosa TaxID=1816 RepID=A0A918GNJ8_9PSEU|nr:FcoT family thioesterase [Actinokineospora fastidiosa]GGS49618.1 hypothetical protein GCM10010171_50930 [Actinokineospora fastidiosa]